MNPNSIIYRFRPPPSSARRRALLGRTPACYFSNRVSFAASFKQWHNLLCLYVLFNLAAAHVYAAEEEPREFPFLDLKTRHAHRGAATSVCFRYNQRELATGSVDGTIKIWGAKADPGNEPKTLRGHKSWVNAVDYWETAH